MALSYNEESVLGIQLESCNFKGFMNAYEVDRGYGGPEEGGWWFDFGKPLASVPFDGIDQAREAFTLIEDKFRDDYKDRRERSSVISEGDLVISAEDRFATAWPDERPYYE